MTSKTERMIELIRKTPMFRQLIPQEAGIGWPIPLRKAHQAYVKLPCFGFRATPEKRMSLLYPPFALVTLAWSNGLPVEYVNLRFTNPDPSLDWERQAGSFPHAAVAGLKVGDYMEKRRALLSLYDELFDRLAAGGAFSPAWSAAFSELLRTLMEPPLEPYYRALAPKFFERFLPVEA